MKILFGNIINPVNRNKFEFINNGFVLINSDGIIEKVGYRDEITNNKFAKVFDYGDNYLVPGFIDMHTHIPQYSMIGMGKGELIDWLDDFIFPIEERFNDPVFADFITAGFFNNIKKYGTTTVVAFSSSNVSAMKRIIKKNELSGIRLIGGNSLMDMEKRTKLNLSLRENINSLADLYEFAKSYENFSYIASPRYAGNCSFELMSATAKFSNSKNIYIQTHLSENRNEFDYVKNIHKNSKNYTDIYYKSGIINERTLLAHCIYLSEKELEIIHNAKSTIVHCPTSNIFLKSGIMPLKKYLKNGLKIGLGTDVAAGFTLDMKSELRNAIESSKILSVFSEDDYTVGAEDVFPLANIEAAKHLKIDKITGNITPGKYADITILKKNIENTDKLDAMLNDIIYSEEKNSIATFYKGKELVYE